MQGLAVVPLFAGYDLRRGVGRIFTYDVTGGHYEEADFQATGSGGRDARTTIKLGFREGLTGTRRSSWPSRPSTRRPTRTSGTGGPDLVRGIYPLVAVVTADGLRPGRRGRGGRAVRRPDRAPAGRTGGHPQRRGR